ncbi:DDRGK domain-containing protein 1-like [Schistocerca gregaria]|uniref:DDRGK domain-containing protein 1-like n=1 Tax=Schistocerca gregaria TaxID=7010 RepID=UPI00211E38DA|nr:DDRGK domain-containing protein 1-like [Schistocerca gregaria]
MSATTRYGKGRSAEQQVAHAAMAEASGSAPRTAEAGGPLRETKEGAPARADHAGAGVCPHPSPKVKEPGPARANPPATPAGAAATGPTAPGESQRADGAAVPMSEQSLLQTLLNEMRAMEERNKAIAEQQNKVLAEQLGKKIEASEERQRKEIKTLSDKIDEQKERTDSFIAEVQERRRSCEGWSCSHGVLERAA